MREFDHSDLDGHLLQLLLAVVEEGSITRAAHRLGVTQSAVSHLLDKLRAIVGDPLFVKSGRGIVPTARALALAAQARLLLEDMRRFVTPEQFDPASWRSPSPLPPTTCSATCCCRLCWSGCEARHRACGCTSSRPTVPRRAWCATAIASWC